MPTIPLLPDFDTQEEQLSFFAKNIPDGLNPEHGVRLCQDKDLEAPFIKPGEAWCLGCGVNLLLCACDIDGPQDKMPALHNLPAEPRVMSHADHYFRFASILEKKYPFSNSWDANRWIGDYGGFLTSVLKTDRSQLLEAAATFEIDIDASNVRSRMRGLLMLGEIQTPWEKYIRTEDPENIPDNIAFRLKRAVQQYAIRATTTLLAGRLAHLTVLDIHFISCDVLEKAEVPVVHKQLLMRVLMDLKFRMLEKIISVAAIPVDWRSNYKKVFKPLEA